MRIEASVQQRGQERVAAPLFEATLQEKLDEEMERHLSVLKIEIDQKKKKLIEEFKTQKESEEKSK